jgi:HK97 family phage portal protein
MLHFLKNTKDGVVGIGLLSYAAESFKLTDNLNNSASDFFGSGCGISGILKFKGQVPEKSKAEIRQQWSQIHAPGSKGAGLAITSSDCDYVPVSQDPSSSQMLESRQFAIAEVARFFGISPLLLQSLENGNTTAIEQISLQFVKYTLMPLVNLIENELNRKLFPGVFDTWIDLDETILLASDKQSLANYLSTLTQNGIMSINEARRQLNLNEVEGGDALIIPYTDLGMNTLNGDTNTTNNIDGEQTQ